MRRKILIQNQPSDAKIVREAVIGSTDGPFQVAWVRSCSDGLERLVSEAEQQQRRPDAIAAVLADLFLPDSHGIDTFDRLFRVAPHIPILVLTTSEDEGYRQVGGTAWRAGLSPEEPARRLPVAESLA